MQKSENIKLNPNNAYLPLALKNKDELVELSGIILAGDVGGTKSNLAIFRLRDGELCPVKEEMFRTKEYNSFVELLQDFTGDDFPDIQSMCIGIAGPVTKGKAQGTNFPWGIDQNEIRKKINLEPVYLINDLKAGALGLGVLDESSFLEIKEGSDVSGNSAIIAPGTGLGEAGLFWSGSEFYPFSSEGGHCDFGPRNDLDLELWRFLHNKFGQVSWERILSGAGIHNIYQFLIDSKKETEPTWLKKKLEEEDPAAVISTLAREGNHETSSETIQLFLRYLAVESAQLALKNKATGGVFIGGGIVPKIIDSIDKETFYKNFVASDKMEDLLKLIPVKAVLNDKTALYGAAVYAAMKIPEKN